VNKFSNIIVAAVALVALAMAVGCGGSDESGVDTIVAEDTTIAEDAVIDDDTIELEEDVLVQLDTVEVLDELAPVVGLMPVPYTAVQGDVQFALEIEDDSEIASIMVLLDGEEAGSLNLDDMSIDTSSWPWGVHQVAFVVADEFDNSTTTEEVPLMCAGPGLFLDYLDGWPEGDTPGWGYFLNFVPEGATSVYDSKAHVQVPNNAKQAVAFLRWSEDVSWNLGFDIGTGSCPDSGTLLAANELDAADGVLEVSYEANGEIIPSGGWFAHVRYLDGTDHGGETLHLHSIFLLLP